MNNPETTDLIVIDSHTAGEPTRVVVEGVPTIGEGDMHARRECMSSQADWVRTSLILEPRGAPWMVGAVLQEPVDRSCAAGVIFFNNTGYLGMCGHGLMGVVTTLAYLDRIGPGVHHLETPAGIVRVHLNRDGLVSLDNVVSYRTHKDASVDVPGVGRVVGDIAYGGNWFFLTEVPTIATSKIQELTTLSKQIMEALDRQGICGEEDCPIDHIELVGPPSDSTEANARNFVMCPGGHYDRSPCGTGTSAKLACLAADGKLPPDTVWVQESITKSIYEATYSVTQGGVVPTITGRAYITGHTSVKIDAEDPLRYGFVP